MSRRKGQVLTPKRVAALVRAAEIGANAADQSVGIRLLSDPPPDAEGMKVLRETQERTVLAREAIEILRKRYLAPKPTPHPTPEVPPVTLFD